MKKWQLTMGLVVALVVALSLSVVAFAQGPQPPVAPGTGQYYGYGMRGSGFGSGFRYSTGGTSLVDITAQVTDFEVAEVIAELQSGKTYTQIAEANGKTAQELVEAFLASHKAALDQAVADGRMTQEWADTMLATMTANIEQHVNGTWQSPSSRSEGLRSRGESYYSGECPLGYTPGTDTQPFGGIRGGRWNR